MGNALDWVVRQTACKSIMCILRRIPFEAVVWISGLVYLAVFADLQHPFGLCLAKRLGLPCLGCGLGRAVGYLLRGDVVSSLSAHPLGIPAVAIIFHRVWVLLRSATPEAGASRVLKGERNG